MNRYYIDSHGCIFRGDELILAEEMVMLLNSSGVLVEVLSELLKDVLEERQREDIKDNTVVSVT